MKQVKVALGFLAFVALFSLIITGTYAGTGGRIRPKSPWPGEVRPTIKIEKPYNDSCKYAQVIENVEVGNKKDLDGIPDIKQAIAQAQESLLGKGRVLVRYSGTQLLCRVMVEGEDENEIRDIAHNLAQLIGNKLN